MKKTSLHKTLQNWKLGKYFRELSIVIAGVFITLTGTDLTNDTSQKKQIKESMLMIKMELEENLKSPVRNEPGFFNIILKVFMRISS